MYIARILYPVKVLGPGSRIGIWFDGCPRRCKGCISPELWEFQEQYRTDISNVIRLIRQIADGHPVDGFTISGGDPLYQPEDFLNLTGFLRTISPDILVYTGYTAEEISPEYLTHVGVLIDGPYIKEQGTDHPLTGSANQRMLILNPELKEKYDACCREPAGRLQNFTTSEHIITVGIPKK